MFTFFPQCDEIKKKIGAIEYKQSDLERAVIALANCNNKGNGNQQVVATPKIQSVKRRGSGFKKYVSIGITGAAGYIRGVSKPYNGALYQPKGITGMYGLSIEVALSNRFSIAASVLQGNVAIAADKTFTLLAFDPTPPYTAFSVEGVRVLSYSRTDFVPCEIKIRLNPIKFNFTPVVSVGIISNRIKDAQIVETYSNYPAGSPLYSTSPPPPPASQSFGTNTLTPKKMVWTRAIPRFGVRGIYNFGAKTPI